MSFVERMLGKVRDAALEQKSGKLPRRSVLNRPNRRVCTNPQLRITPEMWEQLGQAPAEDIEHQRAAEYRHIKRQLLTAIRASSTDRVVVVASSLAGEGKSYTAANLARSMACEPDYTVLLVDADVIKPQISRALALVERPGLMNALADESCDVESLVVTTDVEGLSVLPAGSASKDATEYFASKRMRTVLQRLLAVPNRILLVDSLPLLPTTEARALMPLASQVLLVVRAESTPRAAVQQALALIGPDVKVKLMLNAAVRTRLLRYLGYGYLNYGYDYDYSALSKRDP